MLNNKGMTVIEIIITFAILAVISINLFTIVNKFGNRRQIESDKNELYSFKNILTKNIQDDIVKIGVTNVSIDGHDNYSVSFDAASKTFKTSKKAFTGNYVIALTMRDGSVRQIKIICNRSHDEKNNFEGTKVDDYFAIEYGIVTGGDTNKYVRYKLPNLGVTTNKFDEKVNNLRISSVNISNKDNLFSLNIGFSHPDLGNEYGINIITPINFDELTKGNVGVYEDGMYSENTGLDPSPTSHPTTTPTTSPTTSPTPTTTPSPGSGGGGTTPSNPVNQYIGTKWNYSTTCTAQTFTAPVTAKYKIELWGAQGGVDVTAPGYGGSPGAYTSGVIKLTKTQQLHFYIGAQPGSNTFDGGCNGGGNSRSDGATTFHGYAGGGATDVRLSNGIGSSFISLKTRIMVAAGGTGGYVYAPGGGLYGIGLGGTANNNINHGHAPSQTEAGKAGDTTSLSINCFYNLPKGKGEDGKFGIGGNGGSSSSGGGGGYFGGGGAFRSCVNNGGGVASSGSSYISGHTGCVAIDRFSTYTSVRPKNSSCSTGTSDRDCSIHYSNLAFTDTVMIDGGGGKWTTSRIATNVQMTEPSGVQRIGHVGNGYARITCISE